MKKILVPYDGSDFSVHALSWAIEHRSAPEDEIHLVYVEQEPQAWQTHGMEAQAVEAQLRLHAKEVLDPGQKILEQQKIPHFSHETIGDPPQKIVELAIKLGCTQIIMGTHGHGAFLDLMLGSVATRVLHLAQIPVTLIK